MEFLLFFMLLVWTYECGEDDYKNVSNHSHPIMTSSSSLHEVQWLVLTLVTCSQHHLTSRTPYFVLLHFVVFDRESQCISHTKSGLCFFSFGWGWASITLIWNFSLWQTSFFSDMCYLIIILYKYGSMSLLWVII